MSLMAADRSNGANRSGHPDEMSGQFYYSRVHPQKFMLWVAMASIGMFFIGLTSALIVKKGDTQYWQDFSIPNIFAISTVIIILSSVTIAYAVKFYKDAKFLMFRALLALTFVLSLVFMATQLYGWNYMTENGMALTTNVSGSFVYLISGAHAAHIVGGILVLLIVLIKAIRARKDKIYELRNIINPKRKLNLELLETYWHFVGLLWVYLFIFFKFTY